VGHSRRKRGSSSSSSSNDYYQKRLPRLKPSKWQVEKAWSEDRSPRKRRGPGKGGGQFMKLDPKMKLVQAPERSGMTGTRVSDDTLMQRMKDEFSSANKNKTNPREGRHYKTKVTFGTSRLSKGWHYLRAIAGTQQAVNFDSRFQWDISSTERRERNDFEVGFNQKGFWMDKTWYWTRADIESESDGMFNYISKGDTDNFYKPRSEVVPYLGWIMEKVELVFENTNNYFPTVMKIHMCCLKSSDLIGREIDVSNDGTGNSNQQVGHVERALSQRVIIPNDTVKAAGRVPAAYSLPQADSATPASFEYSQIIHDKDTTLLKSSYFRENFKIVKTYKKVLGPSDTWEFHYTQHRGRGINLQPWMQQAQEGNTNPYGTCPAGYFPIVELVGRKCEAIKTPVDSEGGRAIGTSPVAVTFEAKKSSLFINDNVDALPDILPESDATIERKIALRLIRTNVTKGTAVSRMLNFNYDQLTDDPNDSTANRYIVPITTDVSLKYAGNNAKADGN
jgi:hypothetical protein